MMEGTPSGVPSYQKRSNMKQKILKIGGIIVDVIIVIAFIASIFVVIANISAKNNGGQANVFGYTLDSVQTDSMSGTFEVGALVIGKIPDKDAVLEEGQIITFYVKENGVQYTKTHTISKVEKYGEVYTYQTWGDNREVCPVPDDGFRTIGDVASVYQFHIPLLGGFIDFLKEPIGFILCLLLPMLVFIGWQIYKLIDIYIKGKKQELLEAAANPESVSDEAKDAIIREYLAKMQGSNNTEEAPAPTDVTDGTENKDE